MRISRLKRFRLLFLGALLVATGPARGVILYGTADPTANTNAPTGALAGSGWQYEGQFGSFLGTVIAKNYFITAKHIGGSVGQTFTFNGINYTTTAVFPDPSSDLQIWQIAGTFPAYAHLYSGAAGSEVNLNLVVFGRGTQRGASVYVGSDSHVGGWMWGSSDGLQRWGTNTVGSIVTDATYGDLLRAPFDANAGPNEGHLSSGDSGGAFFVFNTNVSAWELAGINLAVDGPFSTSSGGMDPFNAAMFDTTGLFVQGDQGSWIAAPNPSAFYATEVAAHRGFIESVVMQLVSVVSRKTHGSVGTFDVDLPETGVPGIECRSGGLTNDYTLVFKFMKIVSVQGASVTTGGGSVSSFSVVANQVTVNLTGVANAQIIGVTLTDVSDGINTSNVEAMTGVLVGDVDANGRVSNADVALIQAQVATPVTQSNFRNDVNANGRISNGDVALTQAQVGTTLP